MKNNAARRPALRAQVFAENTSAHGFIFFLTSSGWPARAAWLVLTVAGTVLSIVFTVKICISSFQAPFHSTDMSLLSDGLHVALPDVIVCDPYPWDFDKVQLRSVLQIFVVHIIHFLTLLLVKTTGNYAFGLNCA
jgi:hypothetical protein